MLKEKRSGLLWAVALSVALLAGCNSGGDSKGANASALAAVTVMDKAMLALDFLPNNYPVAKPVVALNRSSSLGKSLAAARTRGARLARVTAAVQLQDVPDSCGVSGTHTTVADGAGRTTDTYVDCVDEADIDGDGVSDVSAYRNGVKTTSLIDATFASAAGNASAAFIEKLTRISDGHLIIASSSTTVASGTIADSRDCNGAGSVVISMSVSGTVSLKVDAKLDGKLDLDESDTMTDLKLELTSSTFDTATCDMTKVTITESGKISTTDHLNAKNSVSIDIAAISPITATWERTPKDGNVGVSTTVTGTMTITSACFTGTMTLATPTPVFVAPGDACPTAGELKVTGGATATITYTSTGGVNIDEGSNGSIDKSYITCNEAGACM